MLLDSFKSARWIAYAAASFSKVNTGPGMVRNIMKMSLLTTCYVIPMILSVCVPLSVLIRIEKLGLAILLSLGIEIRCFLMFLVLL